MDAFLSNVQRHKVTVASLVPPILLGLAKLPQVDNYDLSSLKLIGSGAAPLGEPLAAAVAKRLDCVVTQGYRLTETSPVTHTNPSAEPERIRIATIGQLIPSTQARLVDVDSNVDVVLDPAARSAGASGELWVRGPQVMARYLHNADATAATIDEHGWLRTGDIATVDDDGDFSIVDRLK